MQFHYSRLQTLKYLGSKVPQPYVYNLTGADAFKSARAQGGVNGITLINGVDSNSGVIILKPGVLYDGSRTPLSSWGGDIGNAYQIQNPFGTGQGIGLVYDTVTPADTEATITSVWQLSPNEGIPFKFYPYTTESDNPLHVAFMFGKWRLIFYGQKVLLTRITTNWNIAAEKTALDNQGNADPTLAAASVAAIGPQTLYPPTLSSAIYDVYQELSLPTQNNSSIVGNYYEIWVLPEPTAGMHIAIGSNGFDSADGQIFVPLPNNEAGDVYSGTPLSVYTRSNALFFQIGTMAFAPGALTYGPLSTPYSAADWDDSYLDSNITYNMRSNTPPDTGVSLNHYIIDSSYFEFVASLNTDNPAYTPFLYWAQAALEGGVYVGDTEFQMDTNSILDGFNNSPIMDIKPRCDGDMRRQDFDIDFRDADKIQTLLFAYNGNPQSFMLENQIANLSVGNAYNSLTPVCTGGMITACEAHDAANAQHTPVPHQANGFHPWTKMSMTLSDAWYILDNDIIDAEIAGDGMYLGAYVIYLLINGGFPSDLIAVSATAGVVLPQSALGQNPCVLPRQDQTRGDYLRELFDLYGFDWQLYIDNSGVWQMRQRPTTLATIAGAPAAFISNPTSASSRVPILSELDWIHDAKAFWNSFRVEGAVVNGVRICQEYIIWESVRGIVNVDNANNFLGYEKRYPTVRNDGIRSNDAAQLALRSLVMRYGISPRFRKFTTRFTLELYKWDLITCDGVNFAVWSNDGGSMAEDKIDLQVIQV